MINNCSVWLWNPFLFSNIFFNIFATKESSVTTTASTVDSQSILCPNQNVCKNSGVCRVIGGTFYCVCPEGFYGVLCELYCKLYN